MNIRQRSTAHAFKSGNELGQEFLYYLIYKLSYCNFPESRNKKSKIIFLFYLLILNAICFVEKTNIFLRLCLCIFESDNAKSDCPIQISRKYFCSGDI